MLSTMIFFSDILPFALFYPPHQTAKTFATQYLMGEMDHGKTDLSRLLSSKRLVPSKNGKILCIQ